MERKIVQNVSSLMICPVCKVNPAEKHPYYGYIPCKPCQDRQARLKKPDKLPEFTSDSIKEGRKANFDDIHGAHRKGVPSREFRDRWGEEAMKRQGFTDKEIKNAQYVWGDDKYYQDGN